MLLCPEEVCAEEVCAESVVAEVAVTLPTAPVVGAAPTCRHCGAMRVTRPKGLCWNCYTRPGLKEQYESLNKYGRRNGWTGFRKAPLPSKATSAQPGSEEKVRVLMERASQGVQLFHPDDARIANRFARAG